jgi:hypothetical protein
MPDCPYLEWSAPCHKAVVWGPVQYQGLSICRLYTTQGVKHILTILRHATHPTLTGKLLRTSIEEIHFETGLPGSFLSYSHIHYGSLVRRLWIGSTWQFITESTITLTDPFPKPALACLDDCFLMELLFYNGQYGAELRALNCCQMHLHALRISDLCTLTD